jgi:pyruvate/2-oxoglutarate dehydrogenase complex dihydrolipoamide acyltransferase (E2) component
MERNIENVDAWLVARIGALERANRRLWIGIGALFTTLASLAIAGLLFAAHFEVPAPRVGANPTGGTLRVDEIEVRRALRIVDDQGHDLVWLGRETAGASAGAAAAGGEQTVLGLFAAGDSTEPQQTVRVATSKLGSALSLSSLDGGASSSLFAGKTGVALELRRGSALTSWSEKSGSPAAAAPAAAPSPAEPTAAPAAAPSGRRAESEVLAAKVTTDSGASVDLTNPTLQALGSGFFVGPASVTDSPGGIRVRGRIVNATSVDQARAEFRLTVGRREVAFSVARIAAGASAPFALEMAQSPSSEIRTAHMRWVRSAVSYGTE